MQYELTTLSCLLLEQDAVSAGAHRWVTDPGTAGRLLGAWRSEIGELGQIVVLRGFDEIDELQQERRRALMSGGPFNIGGDHVGLSMETYELFPFLPEIEPSTRGRFYEFRRYWLMPAGIAPTIAAWEQAVGPAEATRRISSPTCTRPMARLALPISGVLEPGGAHGIARAPLCRGLWPPKGGPQQIERATSTICLPEAWSPLG